MTAPRPETLLPCPLCGSTPEIDPGLLGVPETSGAVFCQTVWMAGEYIAACPVHAENVEWWNALVRCIQEHRADALDAAEARIEELEAERDEARRRRDEWRQKAEGYDEVRQALREKVGTPWPPHLSRVLWAGIAADEKKRADDAEAREKRLRNALALAVEAIDDLDGCKDPNCNWEHCLPRKVRAALRDTEGEG